MRICEESLKAQRTISEMLAAEVVSKDGPVKRERKVGAFTCYHNNALVRQALLSEIWKFSFEIDHWTRNVWSCYVSSLYGSQKFLSLYAILIDLAKFIILLF